MPVEITTNATPVDETTLDVEVLLSDKGKLTLEGQVIVGFLESVEFDLVLDDEDVAAHITTSEAIVTFGDDEVEIHEGATEAKEGQEIALVQTLEGEVAAAAIDEDDLHSLFVYYVGQMDESTLEAKTLKAVAISMLGEGVTPENLDEASVFKKGDFRKIRAGKMKTSGGKSGPELVKRMLIAMLKKEAIKRAGTAGAGYKKGDYEKNGAGYGSGTAKGKKAVALYKGKNKQKLKTAAKKVKGGAGADAKLKAKAKAADAKKAALAKLSKPAKEKKALVAHDETSQVANLTESAKLAGKILKMARPLNG